MYSQMSSNPQGHKGMGSSKGFAEKRRHERLTTSVDGEILFGNTTMPIVMLDLSKSGARLRLTEQQARLPKAGEVVELSLVWPLATVTKALHVEASVVRVFDNTIAVEFTHLKAVQSVH